MKIFTSHSSSNPLLGSLQNLSIPVEHMSPEEFINSNIQDGVLGYYGNIFDEIKNWRCLVMLKKKLQSYKAPYVFWNRDAPWNTGIRAHNMLALKLIKPIDIYLTHSMQSDGLFSGSSHYFPNAAQDAYFQKTDLHALRQEHEYKYDVSYFGSCGVNKDRNARLRAYFLNDLIEILRGILPAIRVYIRDTAKEPLSLSEQQQLIRKSKINLNIGAMCDLPNNPTWGLAERVFGIPAAGGFVMSDFRKHLADTFPSGMIPSFDGVESCARQIAELLSDFKKMRSLAENQHNYVHKMHTYQQRAAEFTMLLRSFKQ